MSESGNVHYPQIPQWQDSPNQKLGEGLSNGGGGGKYDPMEARVAKLEALAENISGNIKDLKDDVRGLRKDLKDDVGGLRGEARSDFRILFGALIAVSLGLAGIMAKGFHWF